MYFFEDDDNYMEQLNSDYRNGKILAGEMKQICIDNAVEWMKDLQEKKAETEHLVELFLASDSK